MRVYISKKGVDSLRVLKFIVNGQILEKDPNCDFSGLVPGTFGYIQAEFSFSPEWNNVAKAAGFYSAMGKEYPAKVLEDGKTCMIPVEALAKKAFKIHIVGRTPNSYITTNKVEVLQDGGAK